MPEGIIEIDSILDSVKKNLGPGADYNEFDHDILWAINNAFSTLYDEGLSFEGDPIMITGSDDLWEDYITDKTILPKVKEYVFIKTKLMFDPPNNSFLIEHYNKLLAELEWRIYTAVNDYLPDDVYKV